MHNHSGYLNTLSIYTLQHCINTVLQLLVWQKHICEFLQILWYSAVVSIIILPLSCVHKAMKHSVASICLWNTCKQLLLSAEGQHNYKDLTICVFIPLEPILCTVDTLSVCVYWLSELAVN